MKDILLNERKKKGKRQYGKLSKGPLKGNQEKEETKTIHISICKHVIAFGEVSWGSDVERRIIFHHIPCWNV